MAFRVAKELGIVDVDAMLAGIPMRLFLEWCAYFQVEPFGEERGDLRSGIVASTMANVMSKNSKFKPQDFMPFAKKRRQSVSSMVDMMRAMTIACGGTIKKAKA